MHYFENILLDIGDEQSIEDDLSTFSSHLANIRHVLEKLIIVRLYYLTKLEQEQTLLKDQRLPRLYWYLLEDKVR